MTLTSLINIDNQLNPVEVEISLLPGLPTIQIIGLPDAAIKESVLKIKSALRLQGFQFPKGRMVIINLRPSQVRKSSLGLELAIAMGILLETEQLKTPNDLDLQKTVVYGEINLQGEVFCPEDASYWQPENNTTLITGPGLTTSGYSRYEVKQLAEFHLGKRITAEESEFKFNRPELPQLKFTKEQARLLSIISAGEHAALIVGPSGTGKTTVTSLIPGLLRPPETESYKEIRQVWREKAPLWRPVVTPHHGATNLAIIGGGSPPRIGEITRAHNGILIMDEFLEFDAQVFESLREPTEMGTITISRAGYQKQFPANFLLIATTNLCPCGSYVPKRDHQCTCSNRRRELYLSRLKGPMVDRFSIIAFSDGWDSANATVTTEEIRERTDKAIMFAKEKRNQSQPNRSVDFENLDIKGLISFEAKSRRRRKYLLQVARTCADLDGSLEIKPQHLQEAYELCLKSHQLLTTQLALY